MIGAFDFEDGGRTYCCRVAALRDGGSDAWWWFDVSGDSNRYAPFRAATKDSQTSVRERIIEYYEARLAPAPPRTWTSWRDRKAQADQAAKAKAESAATATAATTAKSAPAAKAVPAAKG